MKDKKLKTYVLMIAKTFPKGHIREGELTDFHEKIKHRSKKHTIRKNYEYWKNAFREVAFNKAIISVREWSGKPYRSKQRELFKIKNGNAAGVQLVQFTPFGFFVNEEGDESDMTAKQLIENDGLNKSDFSSWFCGLMPERMAVIHFTDFRYKDNLPF